MSRTDDYLEFWKNIWEDDSYREVCPECFSMVEIFLSESPENVFAESMGRFMNMIRNNLKNRMGDSLLDALMRGYRHSGHLQFWEPHLDNILFCHSDVMNCSTTNLVCKSKTGITPADVFSFDPNPPKTRNSCKSDDDNLVKDVREISGHINGNRHCETYSIVGMTSPILKLVRQVNQRKSRREDLHRRIDLRRKDD